MVNKSLEKYGVDMGVALGGICQGLVGLSFIATYIDCMYKKNTIIWFIIGGHQLQKTSITLLAIGGHHTTIVPMIWKIGHC